MDCSYGGLQIPANTLRNNDVVITSKRRHFDVITSKWRRFDVITTLLLRHVFSGNENATENENVMQCVFWPGFVIVNKFGPKFVPLFGMDNAEHHTRIGLNTTVIWKYPREISLHKQHIWNAEESLQGRPTASHLNHCQLCCSKSYFMLTTKKHKICITAPVSGITWMINYSLCRVFREPPNIDSGNGFNLLPDGTKLLWTILAADLLQMSGNGSSTPIPENVGNQWSMTISK